MYEIYPLFSYPVYSSNIGYELLKDELDFIENLPKKQEEMYNKNHQNSDNDYVLNLEELKNIKNFIQQNIDTYKTQVLKARSDIEIYITQSWVNYSVPGNFHHRHDHPNSYLSGIFYVNTANTHTTFEQVNRTFSLELAPYSEHNIFNSGSWKLKQKNNNVVIFPSTLLHKVEQNKSNEKRITIAFNTYVRGKIGNETELYGLELK
jgi:uncharacterized protein (TIGR02466 family)